MKTLKNIQLEYQNIDTTARLVFYIDPQADD